VSNAPRAGRFNSLVRHPGTIAALVAVALYAANLYVGFDGRSAAVAVRAGMMLALAASIAVIVQPPTAGPREFFVAAAIWLVCAFASLALPENQYLAVIELAFIIIALTVKRVFNGAYCEVAYLRLVAAHRAAQLGREIELGSAVQTLLLPRVRQVRLGGWEMAVIFRPHGKMSGDWFQFAATPGGGVAMIGDVVGKGPSAALNTAAIAAIWKHHLTAEAADGVDTSAFGLALNRAIFDVFDGSQFTTLSMARLGEQAAELVACGAPSWLLVRGGGVERVRTARCNPLGMQRGLSALPLTRCTVEAGDVLIAFTDGVADGTGLARRFQAAAARIERWDGDMEALVAAIGALDFRNGRELPDDYTMLVLRKALVS
jgi:hypothetical protein